MILGGMFGTPLKGKAPALKAWTFLRDLYEIDGAATPSTASPSTPTPRIWARSSRR